MSSLNQLIQKLAGAQTDNDKTEPSDTNTQAEITDTVYVEKLASAVDFIIDTWSGAPKADEVEKVASVTDLSDKLRTRLQEKLADKQADETEHDADFIDSIMGKLQELKAERAQQEEDVLEGTENIEDLNLSEETPEEEQVEENSVSEETEEAVAKAASAENSSLADVLSAALSTTSDHNESADSESESAKTAGVTGSDGPMARKEATELLKQKLMANLNQED